MSGLVCQNVREDGAILSIYSTKSIWTQLFVSSSGPEGCWWSQQYGCYNIGMNIKLTCWSCYQLTSWVEPQRQYKMLLKYNGCVGGKEKKIFFNLTVEQHDHNLPPVPTSSKLGDLLVWECSWLVQKRIQAEKGWRAELHHVPICKCRVEVLLSFQASQPWSGGGGLTECEKFNVSPALMSWG